MNQRFEELDLLRGLAALTVVFGHFAATFPALAWWSLPFQYGPLSIFIAGHQAVVFFFVLSGFVLSLPFQKGTPVSYNVYITKRILRIYPPYICAVGVAFFFREWLYAGPVPGVGAWFNASWGTPVTWAVAKNYLIMIGPFRGNDFIPVIWSLIHEMRISIIFPALIWLVIRRPKTSFGVAVLVSGGCFALFELRDRNIIREPFALQTLQYVGVFIVGALLARYRGPLVARFAGLSRRAKGSVLGAAVLLYTYIYWLPPWVAQCNPQAAAWLEREVLGEAVTTAGVCLFIVAALSGMPSVLTTRPFKFLGAISYSLYLYHAICLKIAVTVLHGRMPLWLVLLLALAASFGVSALSYYTVERPSVRLGRWLTKRFPVAERRLPEPAL